MTAAWNHNTSQSYPQVPWQPASVDIWDKKYRLKDRDGLPIDQTIDDTLERVARALADIEATEEKRKYWYGEFLWALQHGAIPAGRIISNAGAGDYKPATSTINCTVSGAIRDSMDDILGKLHEAGLTLKCGCGIGYDFSTLRPRGAYVSGAGAHTSGPLSFMDIFDRMCFTISSAGGRRGAQMATFDIGHPDVLDFIKAKREAGRLRQFNLSLLITEPFMQAVKKDLCWPLAFPVTEQELKTDFSGDLSGQENIIWRSWPVHDGYVRNEKGEVACRVYTSVPARFLWDEIMRATYDYAEPGFILIDRINEFNNNWFCEEIRATNPCVTGDTWIHTSRGARQVKDLLGLQFTAIVDGQPHASGEQGFFFTARKEVVKLHCGDGRTLRLTRDHRVRRVTRFTRYSQETEWCEAGNLGQGDLVLLHDHGDFSDWESAGSYEEGYLMGLLLGDGTLKTDKAVLSAWKPAAVVNSPDAGNTPGVDAIMAEAENAARTLPHRSDFCGWTAIRGHNEFRLSTAAIKQLAESLGMSPGHKKITPAIETASSAFYRGLLRALFDCDGSVQGSQEKGVSVRLAQSDLPLLESAQRMLLRMGINSTIYTNRRSAGQHSLPDGKGGYRNYAIKAQHELVITGENLLAFDRVVGFADTCKTGNLRRALSGYQRQLNRERFVSRVASVTPDGIEDVYDVQIPGINSFDANGIHTHNCGEQPLPPYGACLLGSINLTSFVLKPFTENAAFDWDSYRKVVGVFTRMLDNVVEIHGLPLAEQRNEIARKRRHGMGFLGLGSALAMLRMKYGSPESLQFTEDASRELAVAGWKAGLELALEKGPAPIMDEIFTVTGEMLMQRPELARDGYKEGDMIKGKVLHARYSRYMQRLATVAPDLVEALAKTGARFTHHSSIAPTGTISLSLGNNASNGIEPSFAHHYSRNVIRTGKKTKEKTDVYSYELLAYRALLNPEAVVDTTDSARQLPDYFITAADITPKQHVDIQAAAQKWVDSSISKTANVPADFPFEKFKDIYMYAYEQGLKGCTTFRFNPEAFQGVLVTERDLANTVYQFTLETGEVIKARGNEIIEYDGEKHTAANLYDALKEGYYGKY
jgi:ribonucleoside-diphosphate reductase alpha chain